MSELVRYDRSCNASGPTRCSTSQATPAAPRCHTGCGTTTSDAPTAPSATAHPSHALGTSPGTTASGSQRAFPWRPVLLCPAGPRGRERVAYRGLKQPGVILGLAHRRPGPGQILADRLAIPTRVTSDRRNRPAPASKRVYLHIVLLSQHPQRLPFSGSGVEHHDPGGSPRRKNAGDSALRLAYGSAPLTAAATPSRVGGFQ
jgi:hypothetical protein